MLKVFEKHFIYIFGGVLLWAMVKDSSIVSLLLIGLCLTELSILVTKRMTYAFLLLAYGVLTYFYPLLICFLPVLLYEIFRQKWWYHLSVILVVSFGTECFVQIWQPVYFVSLIGLSFWLQYITERMLEIEKKYLNLRDDTTENERKMKEKNKELMEKQDYEIHVATLTERNRIAREIHDNVGHMLSRSILQMGALQTIHKEEPLHGQLVSVSETLNEAMNNIRESVHDLHDESVDLHDEILNVIKEMRERYKISLDYDMTTGVPRNVKYCILSIVKEAMSNIVKHSNATKVTMIFREHPGFYQVLIEDDGSVEKGKWQGAGREPGIGLKNMTDRVESLGGTIHFSAEKGFKILISIAKADR